MKEPIYEAFRQVRFLCDEDNLPDPVFIVTAYNPDGETASDKDNAKADEALRQAIDKLGFSAFRVTGGDFDFSHKEPGWGISCSRNEARALAADFRQLAFFEIRDERVILLPTAESEGRGEDLGDWQLRLDDGEPACPFCLARVTANCCNHLLTTFDSWGGSWSLEENFHEGIYHDLVKGGLVADDDDEVEKRQAKTIRQTCRSVADYITTGELNQGPGFSSALEYLWVREPDAALTRLRELLRAGGSDKDT